MGLPLYGVRFEVWQFARLMEKKLAQKDLQYPNGWKDRDPDYLLKRVKDEVKELDEALSKGRGAKGECVDIANFCMMIVDILRGERNS